MVYVRGLVQIFLSLGALHARDLDQLYRKAEFRVGKQAFTAYLADTDEKRQDGLMFIEKLPPDTGMLFVFEDERPLAFWMKNTLMPLSIGFFDAKSKLVDVQEMTVLPSVLAARPKSYASQKPARLALEMPKGWIDGHHLRRGEELCRKGATGSALSDRQVGLCP